MNKIFSEAEAKVLKALRQDLNLVGFANALEQQFLEPKVFMNFTFEERLENCIEAQCDLNQAKKFEALLRAAKLQKNYRMGTLDPKRYADVKRDLWAHLSSGNWLQKADNIIIVGSSGCGKTSLASALGFLSCQQGYKTLWVRTDDLLTKIKNETDEVAQTKLIERYEKIHTLILDDFLIHRAINNDEARILYRLMDGRDAKLPTIIVTQLNEKGICTRLGGDDFGADGLKNRILGPAYFIELKYAEGRTPSANF